MTRLQGIPHSRIKGMWPRLLPFIERALAHDGGRYEADALFEAIRARKMQAWAAVDIDDGDRIRAVLLTETVNYPRLRACRLFLAAGDELAMMVAHLPQIEAWAAEKGCRSMEARGRLGWVRSLPGYRLSCVVLEKDIKDAR